MSVKLEFKLLDAEIDKDEQFTYALHPGVPHFPCVRISKKTSVLIISITYGHMIAAFSLLRRRLAPGATLPSLSRNEVCELLTSITRVNWAIRRCGNFLLAVLAPRIRTTEEWTENDLSPLKFAFVDKRALATPFKHKDG